MNNVWEYRATKNPFRHPATKNPGIIELCLHATTDEGDIVLDPFAGSGTTGFVAQAMGRKSLLIEINSDYCELIGDRLSGEYGSYEVKHDF